MGHKCEGPAHGRGEGRRCPARSSTSCDRGNEAPTGAAKPVTRAHEARTIGFGTVTEGPQEPSGASAGNPPPLTVAASLVGVQALVLLVLAVLETLNLVDERRSMGLSVTVFFAAYGAVLVAAAWGLSRRATWARGPVLITQLILLGVAWNVREHVAVAIALALCAGVVLAGMLHPDTLAALDRDPTAADDE